MTDWTTNTIMLWNDNRVSDHGREPLAASNERIGEDKRMINGTMRRFLVANKRTWTVNWTNLPGRNAAGGMPVVDGGMGAYEMESFYYNTPGEFIMTIKKGSAINKNKPTYSSLPFEDENFYIVKVMFTDFSINIKKRGQYNDLLDVNLTMVEV